MIGFRIFALSAFFFLTALFSHAQDTLRPPEPAEFARDFTAPHVIVANVPDRHNGRIDRWWMASMFAVGGATAADAATSWGKLESNSILASKNGSFGTKGVAIKGALARGFSFRR